MSYIASSRAIIYQGLSNVHKIFQRMIDAEGEDRRPTVYHIVTKVYALAGPRRA